jgi:hypothetical protein
VTFDLFCYGRLPRITIQQMYSSATKTHKQELEVLLRGWLSELAEEAAAKHGLHSEQLIAINEVLARIDDAVLTRLRLSESPASFAAYTHRCWKH